MCMKGRALNEHETMRPGRAGLEGSMSTVNLVHFSYINNKVNLD